MAEEDVRTRILQVATRLFAHRGYGSTSVREVVEAAGVTKPTLYYWFANKEALYLEAIRTHLDGLTELVGRAIEGPGSARDRLRRFLLDYVGGALEHPDSVLLMMKAGYPAGSGPQVDVASFHLEAIEPLATVIVDGIDAGELRDDLDPRFAVVSLVGTANLHMIAALHGMALPDDYADRVLDIFFRGVAR